MTVGKLHSILTVLVAEGHGRKHVAIEKTSFSHPLESDGCTVLEVVDTDMSWIHNVDDDGGIKVNKDGTESGKVTFVLYGEKVKPEKPK